RPDLLKSEGIPSTEAASNGSPVSGSPKMSTPGGKSRYRSKPRHRRGNSKGSYNEFAGILKNQPAQDEAPPPPPQQPPHAAPGAGQQARPHAHGQDIATCANNLRYFGPAAALRSPLSNHAQRRDSGRAQLAAVEPGGGRPQSPPGLYESAQFVEKPEERGPAAAALGTPQHLASSGLPCKARSLQKSGDESSEEEEGEVDSEVEFPRRQR
ncbi:M3K13 kinase, partial [Climacteris rufus]|nr:M3K13 kinase [Climacteris rufus]